MLYLIATPIGNLADISYRAVETLKTCDYILCEDTRHSIHLLRHYDIVKPLKSFHKFNESTKLEAISEDLQKGKIIGLISDAGTPGISDPGASLVKYCVEREIAIEVIPGPCAAIVALSSSGLSTERFQFLGFLPRKSSELTQIIQEILCYSGTTICYESPNRLLDTLLYFEKHAPNRLLVIARELTKKFQELKRGTAIEVRDYYLSHSPIKGEIVLLVSQGNEKELTDWIDLSVQDHVSLIQKVHLVSQKEAIKMVATLRGVSKREIYNMFIEK